MNSIFSKLSKSCLFSLCLSGFIWAEANDTDDAKEFFDFEVTTPETWTQLHRLQAIHAPEMGWTLRSRQLQGEQGQHLSGGLRWHIREPLSLIYRCEHTRYHNDSQGTTENLSLNHLSLAWDRKIEQIWLAVETGHATHLGGELLYERSLKSGVGLSLGISRHSISESWLSLHYGEVDDRLKTGWSMQLPREFFASGEFYLFSSHLVHGTGSGHGQGGMVEVGINLIPQQGHVMAWQFFDRTLRYPDQLRQNLQLKISQQWEDFEGSTVYFSQLARTTASRGQTLTGLLGLPFSQHSGWELQIYGGQDLERDLKLGKIRGFSSRFLWVPTHATRLELRFNASTENSGVVKGDIFESSISWHVNF